MSGQRAFAIGAALALLLLAGLIGTLRTGRHPKRHGGGAPDAGPPASRPRRLPPPRRAEVDAAPAVVASSPYGVASCDTLAAKVRDCLEIAPEERKDEIRRKWPEIDRAWRDTIAQEGVEQADVRCRGWWEEKVVSMWGPICPGSF